MKIVTVNLPRGLQARNTAIFVSRACKFNCDVLLSKDGKSTDGKKVMRVMDLHVKGGDEITLVVSGNDEKIALNELQDFLLNSDKNI